MATVVLYERDQTIFAGSIKTRHARPLVFLSTKREARPGLVLPRRAWPSKCTRDKHSLSAIQSVRSWLRALIGESMTKHKDDPIFLSVASCTRIVGMGIAMECTHLRKYSSQYVWMTLSHSIVAPRYPWGVKNKSLMRSVPDPSSSCEGAGTQTTF